MSELSEYEPDLEKMVENIDSITSEQRYQEGWVLVEFSNVIYRVLVLTYFHWSIFDPKSIISNKIPFSHY